MVIAALVQSQDTFRLLQIESWSCHACEKTSVSATCPEISRTKAFRHGPATVEAQGEDGRCGRKNSYNPLC